MLNAKIESEGYEDETIDSAEQLEKRLEEIKAERSVTDQQGLKCIPTVDIVIEGIGRISIALNEKCVLMFYDEIEDCYFSSLGDTSLKGRTKDLYNFGQLSETEQMYIVPYKDGLEAVKEWFNTKNISRKIKWTDDYIDGEELLLHSAEELKQNIVRFSFSDGGFFNGYGKINLVKNDTQIKYTYTHSVKRRKEESIFEKEKWDTFINKIFEENIHKWQRRYDNNDIYDGRQWNLRMEFKGLPSFKSYGSNEYPDNWESFEKIIFEYFPQME
jgi:hypothetical protein